MWPFHLTHHCSVPATPRPCPAPPRRDKKVKKLVGEAGVETHVALYKVRHRGTAVPPPPPLLS
jgi:hypothetical protein